MSNSTILTEEFLPSKIYLIREKKVMLAGDLAKLYQVEVKRLNEQVKRNAGRFPESFMFRLTFEEYKSLRSHFATLKQGEHTKYPPYAFTEYGILMLSGVLKSITAEKVNILIIETFVKLNKMLNTNKHVLLKIEEMEKRISGQDIKLLELFEYLKQFIRQDIPRKKIGFKSD